MSSHGAASLIAATCLPHFWQHPGCAGSNSSAIVVQYALKGQNVMVDDDAATVLRLYVSDPLQGEIERIDSALGEGEDSDEVQP
jgi:hypothetical protein